jgi:hydroxymethylpyrimidine/phosphomethylpyrimidine kinase
VLPIPVDTIKAQIDSVLSDLGADGVKIGMLGSKEVMDAVIESLDRHYLPTSGEGADVEVTSSQPRRALPPIVLDSVMVAKGGQPLLDESAIAHLPAILRYSRLVTPNIPEALLLLKHLDRGGSSPRRVEEEERVVTTVQHMREVAEELSRCLRAHHGYTGAVLVKGGHLEEEKHKHSNKSEEAAAEISAEDVAVVVDVLCDSQGRLSEYTSPRIHTRSTHGTGCTLSSAIAAELARGRDLQSAVKKAVRYVHGAIVHAPAPDDATPATALAALPSAYSLGSGHGPLDHMWKLKPLLLQTDAVVTAKPTGSEFGAELWRSIEGVFEKIIAHPFIQGLTSGNLPEDVFQVPSIFIIIIIIIVFIY